MSPTERRKASTVFSALACWTTSSTTLSRMMPTMSAKLVTSPVHAESPLANSRMTIRGLAKRSRNWRHRGRRRWSRASFGPYLASRRATSRPLSPLGVDPSSASNRGRGRFQGRLSTIFAGLKDTICSPKRAPFSEGISPGDVGVRHFFGRD